MHAQQIIQSTYILYIIYHIDFYSFKTIQYILISMHTEIFSNITLYRPNTLYVCVLYVLEGKKTSKIHTKGSRHINLNFFFFCLFFFFFFVDESQFIFISKIHFKFFKLFVKRCGVYFTWKLWSKVRNGYV